MRLLATSVQVLVLQQRGGLGGDTEITLGLKGNEINVDLSDSSVGEDNGDLESTIPLPIGQQETIRRRGRHWRNCSFQETGKRNFRGIRKGTLKETGKGLIQIKDFQRKQETMSQESEVPSHVCQNQRCCEHLRQPDASSEIPSSKKRARREDDEADPTSEEDVDAEECDVQRQPGRAATGAQYRAWEFVLHVKSESEGLDAAERLKRTFRETTREFLFQLERGKEGERLHIQGFVSFKHGKRLRELQKWIHPGSSCRVVHDRRAIRDYVSKSDSRVAGPWSNRDPKLPRQYVGITLRCWQQEVRRLAGVWDTRHIDVLVDSQGGRGKSTLVGIMCCGGEGRQLPALNCGKDLLRAVASLPVARTYFIDLPRAIGQCAAKWSEFYGAIEQLKSGYAWDDRYKFKEIRFDSPNIWIFSNTIPSASLLSRDRWRVWSISADHQLERVNDDSPPGHGPPCQPSEEAAASGVGGEED